jgi:hypothetical protein
MQPGIITFCAAKKIWAISQDHASSSQIRDTKTNAVLRKWHNVNSPYFLEFSPNGGLLIALYEDQMSLIDTTTGERIDKHFEKAHTDQRKDKSVNRSAQDLGFDVDGAGVHLPDGFISFASEEFSRLPFDKAPSRSRPSISCNGEWLYINNVRRLWLPSSHVARRVSVINNTLFVTHKDNSLSIWQLNL